MKDDAFLPTEPPPIAVRGVGCVLLLGAGLALASSVVVWLPETASGRFVLVPAGGADVVRAPVSGPIEAVEVAAGDVVAMGETLVAVRGASVAAEVSDADADWRLVATSEERAALVSARNEANLAVLRAELGRIDARVRGLAAELPTATRRAEALAARVATEASLVGTGAVSAREVEALRVEADAAELARAERARELSEARAERVAAAAAITRAEAEAALEARALTDTVAAATTRSELFGAGTLGPDGVAVLTAPCDGTVLSTPVRTGYVAAGEVVVEVACAGATLVAEIQLPDDTIGRVATGQRAKLRYDAWPYARFGVFEGEVAWVSPVGADEQFRVRVTPADAQIGDAPLRAGLAGDADVVVGRRPVLALAFEPVRALVERLR